MRYVVGDLQGCLDPLLRLLDEARFDPVSGDVLWLVGDLVNRGPKSLESLRFVHGLGCHAVAVLGNHDLALLAAYAALGAQEEPKGLLGEVLRAPDGAELLEWLRQRPLLHVEGAFAMVHAGLLPTWSVAGARRLATEVEDQLRGTEWREFLRHLFGNSPDAWDDSLLGWDRLRVVVNAMTRMRFMTPAGVICMKEKGGPDDAAPGLIPWYASEQALWRTHTILCGHWSAQGYRDLGNIVALDSGCVWGGCLTMLRLEDRKVFSAPCPPDADRRAGD